jgi:hypothetical protein
MEVSQWNTCIPILNKEKLPLFCKSREQEGKMGSLWRIGTSEKGRK